MELSTLLLITVFAPLAVLILAAISDYLESRDAIKKMKAGK